VGTVQKLIKQMRHPATPDPEKWEQPNWIKPKLMPKTRSWRFLEACGWRVGDAERIIPGTRITQDMYGFADLACFFPGEEGWHLLVQATSTHNIAARKNKIDGNDLAEEWLRGKKNLLAVHGWSFAGPNEELTLVSWMAWHLGDNEFGWERSNNLVFDF